MNALAEPYIYDFAIAPCGSLVTRLAATEARLRPSGALWLVTVGVLVVGVLPLE